MRWWLRDTHRDHRAGPAGTSSLRFRGSHTCCRTASSRGSIQGDRSRPARLAARGGIAFHVKHRVRTLSSWPAPLHPMTRRVSSCQDWGSGASTRTSAARHVAVRGPCTGLPLIHVESCGPHSDPTARRHHPRLTARTVLCAGVLRGGAQRAWGGVRCFTGSIGSPGRGDDADSPGRLGEATLSLLACGISPGAGTPTTTAHRGPTPAPGALLLVSEPRSRAPGVRSLGSPSRRAPVTEPLTCTTVRRTDEERVSRET